MERLSPAPGRHAGFGDHTRRLHFDNHDHPGSGQHHWSQSGNGHHHVSAGCRLHGRHAEQRHSHDPPRFDRHESAAAHYRHQSAARAERCQLHSLEIAKTRGQRAQRSVAHAAGIALGQHQTTGPGARDAMGLREFQLSVAGARTVGVRCDGQWPAGFRSSGRFQAPSALRAALRARLAHRQRALSATGHTGRGQPNRRSEKSERHAMEREHKVHCGLGPAPLQPGHSREPGGIWAVVSEESYHWLLSRQPR